MESPPSFSTLSEAPPLSEDSGLLITSGSFSSDSASGWHHVASELQESDFDERSLSLCESADASERMCGDFFNTVKKGPSKVVSTTIEPPPEFQDGPIQIVSEKCAPTVPNNNLADKYILGSLDVPACSKSPIYSKRLKPGCVYERRQCLNARFTSRGLLQLSPCRGARPSSRNSLSSRLSSSHNSLVTQFQADDSTFITQAISHDTLSAKTSDITDMYNVPFDSDIYAVPVDVVRPGQNMLSKGKKALKNIKKREKSSPITSSGTNLPAEKNSKPTMDSTKTKDSKSKRHSLPGSSNKKNCTDSDESVHLTLREMRRYLHTLYSNSSEPDYRNTIGRKNNALMSNVGIHNRNTNSQMTNTNNTASTAVFLTESKEVSKPVETNNNNQKKYKTSLGIIGKSKKHKDNNLKEIRETERNDKSGRKSSMSGQSQKPKMSPVRILSLNLKESFCNLFGWRRGCRGGGVAEAGAGGGGGAGGQPPAAVRRALPPLPSASRDRHLLDDDSAHFANSIQKVKDYGWYWGPLSVEAAEKILSNEPDGSFIVRDSSDDHYIFTLTFKLNGLRHVRIEHDQGNFCFGGCTMFKASTIVEFIENAVETSRSGRYLFFLNLRPVHGPVRVQLLYPVSRFKRVQSLQHMCRFAILKNMRRDLINELPLPRRLLDYLSTTHYYAELLSDI